MISAQPPTSKSSGSFKNSLVTVPKAPIRIDIIVTFMFHSFFNSLARSRYLSFFSHSFSFILWSAGTAKSTILPILSFLFFFLLIIINSGLLVGIRWSVCISYTPFVLICCIRLLCDWWFCFYHHTAYICYFVESYLFSLWYDWFLWRCFVLL